MIRRWAAASIRVRLTTWYTLALSLMLVLYAGATYLAVRHEFLEQLEDERHGDSMAAGGDAHPPAEESVERQLREILVVLLGGLPIVVGFAAVGGYILARRALRPIDDLGAEAKRITAERLHERLSMPNPNDEIGRLAAVINDTFARLESSFEQLRRFTADASHELRTPLSVIRGTGELGLRETRTPAEYQEAIGSMLEEVDRLTRLVDTLLRLSRGDAGTIKLNKERVDLGQLTRDAVASLAVLAEERQQTVKLDVSDGVIGLVDRLVVREAITNIVDNAIKYSPHGSTIAVSVSRQQSRAVIAIADEGPGIPAAHRERVFDRFYRVDEGRSRHTGGTGLGLAIAKWAVEANGGVIELDAEGRGTIFQIWLPNAVVER
jgi:heavy metal sensor kinase